jgi:hypothetical protein
LADILDHVDAILIEPFADDAEADIGLVLMIGHQKFDLDIGIAALELGDRLLDTGHRGRPRDVTIDAGHIGDDTDLDRLGGTLRADPRQRGQSRGGERSGDKCASIDGHVVPSKLDFDLLIGRNTHAALAASSCPAR